MKFCFFIGRRLIAYSEGEVSSNERARIEAHLAGCSRCRERAQQTRRRIDLMRQLPLLDPATELWDAVASGLSAGRSPENLGEAPGRRLPSFGRRTLLRPAAIAAAIFIAATALLLAGRFGLLPDAQRGELNLAGYLDLIGTVAAAEPVLREFPAAPGFTEVRWPEARSSIAFPVIAPEILPGGYLLAAVRLYSHGDFRALQLKYRSEREGLCVFQLPADSTLSFGERAPELCEIDGVLCRRLNSVGCAIYPFVSGETQYALMMRQQDPAMVRALIQAFTDESKKFNHR